MESDLVGIAKMTYLLKSQRIDYNGVGALRRQRYIPIKNLLRNPPPPGGGVVRKLSSGMHLCNESLTWPANNGIIDSKLMLFLLDWQN